MMHHRVTKKEYDGFIENCRKAAIRNELTYGQMVDPYGQLVTLINGIPNAWKVDAQEITKFYILK